MLEQKTQEASLSLPPPSSAIFTGKQRRRCARGGRGGEDPSPSPSPTAGPRSDARPLPPAPFREGGGGLPGTPLPSPPFRRAELRPARAEGEARSWDAGAPSPPRATPTCSRQAPAGVVAACAAGEGDGAVPPDADAGGALRPPGGGLPAAKGAAALIADGPGLLLVDGLPVEPQDLLQRQRRRRRAWAAAAAAAAAAGRAREGLVAPRRSGRRHPLARRFTAAAAPSSPPANPSAEHSSSNDAAARQAASQSVSQSVGG